MRRPHVYERSAPRAKAEASQRLLERGREGEAREKARNNKTRDLITDLIDAAINVKPGRRDIDTGLQRAEHALLRHLGIEP